MSSGAYRNYKRYKNWRAGRGWRHGFLEKWRSLPVTDRRDPVKFEEDLAKELGEEMGQQE